MASFNRASLPYQGWINQYAKQYGVDPALVTSVIQHESGFKNIPSYDKNSTAYGLGQVNKDTAESLGFKYEDTRDPQKSIEMVAKNLSLKGKEFGNDPTKTLVAYYRGSAGARKYYSGKATPKEQQEVQQYLSDPIYQQYINPDYQASAPVKNLPQRKGSLQGEELLEAQPQTEEQAVQQEAQPAMMGITPEQQQQIDNAKAIKDARDAENQKQLEIQKQKQNLYATGAMGLISLLGKKKKQSSESYSGVKAGESAEGYDFSAPTKRAINTLYGFGSR